MQCIHTRRTEQPLCTSRRERKWRDAPTKRKIFSTRWETQLHEYHLLCLLPTGAYRSLLPSTLLESTQWKQNALYTSTRLLQTGRTHPSGMNSGGFSQPPTEGPGLAQQSGRRKRQSKRYGTSAVVEEGGFSKRLNPLAWVRALCCNSVYLMHYQSMQIPVSTRTSYSMADK